MSKITYPTKSAGDKFFATEANEIKASVNDLHDTVAGTLQGPQGLQGDPGPQGLQGLQGDPGPQGPPITGLATVDGVITSSLIRQATHITYTPTGTTQTINLGAANHQELYLTSATGATTVTLTIPDGPCAGNIFVKQHASAVRNLIWAVSSGTVKWLGTQPTWTSDAVSAERIISWLHSNGKTFLSASPIAV